MVESIIEEIETTKEALFLLKDQPEILAKCKEINLIEANYYEKQEELRKEFREEKKELWIVIDQLVKEKGFGTEKEEYVFSIKEGVFSSLCEEKED